MRRTGSAFLLLAFLALTASCARKREFSPAELEQLVALRGEAAALSRQIGAAAEDDERYSGGLIKSLIAVRLEILRTTKALVDQRIQAVESGSPVTVVTVVANPDPARALSLATEIERAETDLEQARREAARYSGGLVAAFKASTVATQEHTLAMLRQQFVLAKYGLALPEAQKKDAEAAPLAAPAQSTVREDSTPEPTEQPAAAHLKIVDISTRVTESNSSWWKYAWRLTVRNASDQPLRFDAHIEFQDKDGFVVDDAQEHGLILRAGEEDTFTGYDLIDADVASNVEKVYARVRER